jgi:hypothetical protein
VWQGGEQGMRNRSSSWDYERLSINNGGTWKVLLTEALIC